MSSSSKPSLSVVLITHNAARLLKRTLSAVSWADEIVVLDSGSSDGTREFAERLGARVIRSDEWKGFGPQKNLALSQARGDWVLLLDADEIVDPVLADEIRRVIATRGAIAGCTVKRVNHLCGEPLRSGGSRPERLPRLFQRGRGRVSDDRVHEVVLVDGPLGHLRGALLHYSTPSVSERVLKNDDYSSIIAEERFRAGERASFWQLLFIVPLSLLRDLVLRRGLLDGRAGVITANLGAFYAFSKYAKLWELERRAARKESAALVDPAEPPGQRWGARGARPAGNEPGQTP